MFPINEVHVGRSRTNREEEKIKQHKTNIQLANFILHHRPMKDLQPGQ